MGVNMRTNKIEMTEFETETEPKQLGNASVVTEAPFAFAEQQEAKVFSCDAEQRLPRSA